MLNTDKDYVIASDTDSIYVTFDDLIQKVNPKNPIDFLDTIAKEKIEPFIDKSYKQLADYVHAYDQKMFMKREVIADKGIWTAKKRYILNAWDVEGVRFKEPQLKIMGIEIVKSSTPAPCRAKIKEALKIIMSGDEKELNDFLLRSVKSLMTFHQRRLHILVLSTVFVSSTLIVQSIVNTHQCISREVLFIIT